MVQITAGSLLGDFGDGPYEACQEFFRRGLVHLVASDAHSIDRRPPAAAGRARSAFGASGEATPRPVSSRRTRPRCCASEPLPWRGAVRPLSGKAR